MQLLSRELFLSSSQDIFVDIMKYKEVDHNIFWEHCGSKTIIFDHASVSTIHFASPSYLSSPRQVTIGFFKCICGRTHCFPYYCLLEVYVHSPCSQFKKSIHNSKSVSNVKVKRLYKMRQLLWHELPKILLMVHKIIYFKFL